MADGFTISADASELLALIGKAGDAVDDVCRDVSRETAKRIVFGARSRVRRATGHTKEGIHYEETRDKKGYVVLAYDVTVLPHLAPVDYYLEYGTRYMQEHPFFRSAALVEEAGHLRRMTEAVALKLEEMGF